MIRDAKVVVSGQQAGGRLDVVLGEVFPQTVRAFIREAVGRGDILVGGKVAAKGRKVREGEEIWVREMLESGDNHVVPDGEVVVDIVYDDGELLGVDKPRGMAVQPLSPRERGTLMNGVVARFPELMQVGDEPLIAGAVHRIDAGTSGLVVVARNNAIFAKMRELFGVRQVVKTYVAMVEGSVQTSGKVNCVLVHDPRVLHCRMVNPESLPMNSAKECRAMRAETVYRPLHKAGKNTLLEVTIMTGVTHQIRAQLAMIGHPIVGDKLYGAEAAGDGGFRLHSVAAEFEHPTTKIRTKIQVPIPAWAQ